MSEPFDPNPPPESASVEPAYSGSFESAPAAGGPLEPPGPAGYRPPPPFAPPPLVAATPPVASTPPVAPPPYPAGPSAGRAAGAPRRRGALPRRAPAAALALVLAVAAALVLTSAPGSGERARLGLPALADGYVLTGQLPVRSLLSVQPAGAAADAGGPLAVLGRAEIGTYSAIAGAQSNSLDVVFVAAGTADSPRLGITLRTIGSARTLTEILDALGVTDLGPAPSPTGPVLQCGLLDSLLGPATVCGWADRVGLGIVVRYVGARPDLIADSARVFRSAAERTGD